jgi:RNA polymerase sigma factor (sigma-70 family)
MNDISSQYIPEEDLVAVRLSLLRNWMRQGVSKPDAEDLVQAGLLRGLMNLQKYRGEASLKTWLIAVGKNAGYDFLRKEARQGRIKRRLFDTVEGVRLQRQSARRKVLAGTE